MGTREWTAATGQAGGAERMESGIWGLGRKEDGADGAGTWAAISPATFGCPKSGEAAMRRAEGKRAGHWCPGPLSGREDLEEQRVKATLSSYLPTGRKGKPAAPARTQRSCALCTADRRARWRSHSAGPSGRPTGSAHWPWGPARGPGLQVGTRTSVCTPWLQRVMHSRHQADW